MNPTTIISLKNIDGSTVAFNIDKFTSALPAGGRRRGQTSVNLTDGQFFFTHMSVDEILTVMRDASEAASRELEPAVV